jgi:cytochrome c-type biogenesis protein CcmH/NrfF
MNNLSNTQSVSTRNEGCAVAAQKETLRVRELLEIIECQQEELLGSTAEISYRLTNTTLDEPSNGSNPASYLERLDRIASTNQRLIDRLIKFINEF